MGRPWGANSKNRAVRFWARRAGGGWAGRKSARRGEPQRASLRAAGGRAGGSTLGAWAKIPGRGREAASPGLGIRRTAPCNCQTTDILTHPSIPHRPITTSSSTSNMPATVKTSVPSANDVLMPETLLKKRRGDTKAREQKAADRVEAKRVSRGDRSPLHWCFEMDYLA